MDRSQTSNCVPSESTKQSMSKCQFYLPDLICFGPPTQNELTLNETALQFSAAEIKEILQNNQLFVHFEPVLNQEQLSAAITIQRAYRHYKSKHLKSQNVPESCCVESQETPVLRDTSSLMKKNSSNIDSNVVCIQKYIRSAIEQQRFHHKRSLITKLQTLCRQFLARRRIVVRQQEEARQWHTVEQKLFGPWTLTLAEEMESVNETTTTPQSQFSFLLQRFLEHNRRWERWAEVDMSQTIHIATLRGLSEVQYQELVKDLNLRRQQLTQLRQEREFLLNILTNEEVEVDERSFAATREDLLHRQQEQLRELQQRLQDEMEHVSFPHDVKSIQERWNLNDNFEPLTLQDVKLAEEHIQILHSPLPKSFDSPQHQRSKTKSLQWADEQQGVVVSFSPLHHSPKLAALPPSRSCLRSKRSRISKHKENVPNEKDEHSSNRMYTSIQQFVEESQRDLI